MNTGWFTWSCTHDTFGDAALALSFVPLVGPWLMLSDAQTSGATYLWPIVMGLVQDVGFGLLLAGLLGHEVTIADGVSVRAAGGPSSGAILIDGAF